MSIFRSSIGLSAAALIAATFWGATDASAITIVDKGTYTLDTSTHLQWLDLAQTGGFTYNQVISNTGVNFIGQGWRYATAAELGTFFTDAGGSGGYPEVTETSTIAANPTWTTAALLADLMGTGSNDSYFAYQGILADLGFGSPDFRQAGRFFAANYGGGVFHSDLLTDDGAVQLDLPGFSSFLVKSDVATTPLPPSLVMFLTALGGLGFIAWKRKRASDGSMLSA